MLEHVNVFLMKSRKMRGFTTIYVRQVIFTTDEFAIEIDIIAELSVDVFVVCSRSTGIPTCVTLNCFSWNKFRIDLNYVDAAHPIGGRSTVLSEEELGDRGNHSLSFFVSNVSSSSLVVGVHSILVFGSNCGKRF